MKKDKKMIYDQIKSNEIKSNRLILHSTPLHNNSFIHYILHNIFSFHTTILSIAGDGCERDIDDIEAEQRRRIDLKDELIARYVCVCTDVTLR